MGDQSSLIYCFVARGTTVLAEYTAFSGNFSTIANQCLQKLPPGDNKHTYVCDHHTFNFLVADGFAFLAVADEDFGRQVPFTFLERVKEDFRHKYQGGRADLAVAGGLNSEFGPKLKEHMEYVAANPEETKKMTRIKSQVAEVKGIMMVNIEKVLEHNEKIDLLVGRTADLEGNTQHYQKQSNKIRTRACCSNLRLKLMVFALLIIVVFVIYLSICRGFVCHTPGIPGTIPGPPAPPAE